MTLRLAAVLIAIVTIDGHADEPVTLTESEQRRVLRHSPLPPPPATSAVDGDPRAVRLGHWLFFDTRLSGDGAVACATCHSPDRGFSDGLRISEGLGRGTRNTLSIWNVAYNRWFFWDGRADSLWSQALQPIEQPNELGSNRLALAHLVASDPRLDRAYTELFGPLPDLGDAERFPAEGRPIPDQPDHPHAVAWRSMRQADRDAVDRVYVNVARAIAAYERQLVSRDAPFDRYVRGLRDGDDADRAAISPAAIRGLKLFVGVGECRLCHSGPPFTDGEFHDVRVPPLDGGIPTDPGRFDGIRALRSSPFNAAGVYSDDPDGPAADRLAFVADGAANWGRFKTPTLRNVALTAPYMHQGQFDSLREVLTYYATLQGAVPSDHHDETILVPRNFTESQIDDLIAFLESLTDEGVEPALLAPPPSPLLED